MNKLEALKREILADGKIDAAEVEQLKKVLYADGVIDKEEANLLFDLNDIVSGKDNTPSWSAFFVTAISDYLLKDEISPDVIDEDEANWLKERIGADGKVDGVEKELLTNLIAKAKVVPDNLKKLLK